MLKRTITLSSIFSATLLLAACQPSNDQQGAAPRPAESTSPMEMARGTDDAMAKLMEAVGHPDRPAAEAARDVHRNPAQTLQFFGVSPQMTVIELSPGGGWYSEILARYLKDEGQLIGAHWDLDADISDMYRRIRGQFDERFADQEAYGDVMVIPFNPPNDVDLGEPGSVDVVLSFRNMHSWTRAGTLPAVFDAAFEVLKPGGVMGIVGHRLPEDRAQDPEARSGYVHQSYVVEMAQASGFVLGEASEINANPMDTADHPNGVWNLPPSNRVAEGDEKDYAAIGESDRFTLRFVKPDQSSD